jgi:hypothetical protein
MGSLRRGISNLQACSDEVGGAVVRFSWLFYFGSGSGVGGRLSIFTLFCESVGLYVGISDGGGGLFFKSPVVWQPVAADCSSSPFLHMMVADVRSTCMMWRGGVVGPWILRHQQCLKPPVRIGGGFGCSLGGSPVGENSDGLEKFRELEFVLVNSKFSRVRDVKGWGCTVLKS